MSEKSIEINGGNVVYEILGEDRRFHRADAGWPVQQGHSRDCARLAEALVDGGYRVLLWDRPNCGKSDVQFYGQSESHMRAETLHALISALDIGPCILAGGSGGARDSMLTAMLYPGIVRKLVVWNIVGGVYGSFVLGSHYVVPSILAFAETGCRPSSGWREWRDLIEQNPVNKQRFLDFDADQFLKVMLRWLNAYVPKPGQTIPGVDDEMFDNIKVPTLIIRGGQNDWDHPKRTSLEVSCLIKGSELIDPPWPEDAWETSVRGACAGQGQALQHVRHLGAGRTSDPRLSGPLMSRGQIVRMWTSQFSEASSAVWIRLSGTRARSALRSVTYTTSQPASPGVRLISPVSPNPASTPCASSSVPLLMYVRTPATGSGAKCVSRTGRLRLA